MPVASVLSDITTWVTSAIGDYGLYAVFLLMLVDAVFPAASEVVMVYAGAVASGAFADQDVVLFGTQIDQGFTAYLAMALAGTIGYTVDARISSVTAGGSISTSRSSSVRSDGSSGGRTGRSSSAA